VIADVAETEERALLLGATNPDFQPGGDRFTVLTDPVGQPLLPRHCLGSVTHEVGGRHRILSGEVAHDRPTRGMLVRS
jgi:hypothetical protein